MLTTPDEAVARTAPPAVPRTSDAASHAPHSEPPLNAAAGRLAKALRVEWLGQTAASVCWIASVFAYGIGSAGDWLQLCAASAWLLANIAAALAAGAD